MVVDNIYMLCIFILAIFQFKDAYAQRYHPCRYPTTELNKCWAPMGPHFKDLDKAIIPLFTETQLNTVCSTYQGVRQCVRNYFNMCHISYSHYLDYKGVDDSYNYVCNEARQGYLDHKNCFANHTLVTMGNECKLIMDHSLAALMRDPNLHGMDVCNTVNDYLHCVEAATVSICGVQAALWLRELDIRNIEPTTEYIGCELDASRNFHLAITTQSPRSNGSTTVPLNRKSSTVNLLLTTTLSINGLNAQTGHRPFAASNGVIIGCTVALGLILIGIAALVLIKVKCNKKKNTTSRSSPYAVNMPVQYQAQAVATPPVVSIDPLPIKNAQPPATHDFPTHVKPYNPPAYEQKEEPAQDTESQPPPYSVSDGEVFNPLYGSPWY